MEWNDEEVEYLRLLESCSRSMARDYHKVHFAMRSLQNKLRIPTIIIGSFTGVASFGTSTFPKEYQSRVSIFVGLINVAIAIFQTIESFFKIGENINLSATASSQFIKLADDICKELALEARNRETSGAHFVRDCHTRYQQILSIAPMLSQFKQYIVDNKNPKQRKSKGMIRQFIDFVSTNNNSPDQSIIPSRRVSVDEVLNTGSRSQKEANFEKLRQMTFKHSTPHSMTERFTESKPRLVTTTHDSLAPNYTPINDFAEHVIDLTPVEEKA
jgi:hypothetical protein